MNRFQIEQQLAGVRASLKDANEKLVASYSDTTSTIEARTEKAKTVKDLEEREQGLKAQLDKFDVEANAKLAAQRKVDPKDVSEKDKIINAKANLIKATMAGEKASTEVMNVLGDGSAMPGGQKILPSTMTTTLVTEPFAKNPLRGISTFTNITNLEVPKISFSLDDDDFLKDDTETAKELKAEADTIAFDRNKFKVFCDIPETVLNGTATNLVVTVDAALESGLAKKEKKVAFASGEKATPMSFYNQTVSGTYDIKVIKKPTLYAAIKGALADLEDDYAENAKITMRKTDYFDIIDTLSNGSATLYTAQPEQILGAPVIFCDLATIPVIGDYSYSHFNYDENMIYDRDKNVKTGLESFVLTAWVDHKIKLKSAFRLAIVTP